ncbi:MAG TPA: GNAT family protein [Actinomycetota bacterium]|nr:GNAT family protein [Actinomycetota bacterium]
MTLLAGKHVQLRRVEPGDYPAIQEWQNDPEVFYWMDYERAFSLDDIRQSEEHAVTEGHPFVIVAEGRTIGRIGLNNFRARDEMASLYIFVGDREVRGKGYGIDALMALIAYGFDALNLRKIELWTLAHNERAIRMYKAAGFVEDGRIPERSYKEDRWADHLVMSIDRESFARSRASYGI